jgi:hypothetical protein
MSFNYTLMTELDAINTILTISGEYPVNSLSDTGDATLTMAKDIFHKTNREVQSYGFNFNTEEDYPLVIDTNGYINIPTNTLKVDPTDRTINAIQRGTKLYDKVNHTYVFKEGFKVNITFFLPFEELPQTVRDYITIKAARQYQARFKGSETIHKLTQEDEYKAWLNLLHDDAEAGDYSIFDSYDVYRIIER